MRNGRVARDLALLPGARRESAMRDSAQLNPGICWQGLGSPYPLWILDRRATPQQGQRSATRRAVFWQAPGGVAPQSESAAAIFLRRALPAGLQKTARPSPIYEIGSRRFRVQDWRCADSTVLISQGMANRSTTTPNPGDQNVGWKRRRTCPPSASDAKI